MKNLTLAAALSLGLMAACGSADAAVIDWTSWTSGTPGQTNGSATGTAGGIGITYSGELQSLSPYGAYPSWGPASTFAGGTISNPPPPSGGIIQLFGMTGATDTITFSQSVTNPVFAIWSLGQGGINATFDFTATPTFEAGGPSSEYGGSAITVAGNVVSGSEGNGSIEFFGTFDSITWTNPTYENWYGFTVGVQSSVPEPSTWAMMILGFAAIGFFAHRRNKSGTVAA